MPATGQDQGKGGSMNSIQISRMGERKPAIHYLKWKLFSGIVNFWLQPGPDFDAAAIWKVNQWMDELSLLPHSISLLSSE